jgi:hypothetical protein
MGTAELDPFISHTRWWKWIQFLEHCVYVNILDIMVSVQHNICILNQPLLQTITESWCSGNNCKMCGCLVHHVFIRWQYDLFTVMWRKLYQQNIVALPFNALWLTVSPHLVFNFSDSKSIIPVLNILHLRYSLDPVLPKETLNGRLTI